MQVRRRIGALSTTGLLLVALLGLGTVADAADPPPLQVLSPGLVGSLVEEMPINVVMVGYDEGPGPQQVDTDRLLAGQADVTAGLSRFDALFGVILPTYTAMFPDYRVTFADDAFEDAFFAHLAGIGQPAPLTSYQAGYNEQAIRSATVHDNLGIDAPSVEAWLGDHAPELGVDPSEPTVFLVNWFGRPDFRFHVYSKLGSDDTDFGTDFGAFDSRRLIAWGGTPNGEDERRIWFHDLSAGPEFNTENWDLVTADLDGDGAADFRLPPVWEYGNTDGYRPFTDLSGDLGKVLRYVHLDMLLAPSPIYRPSISPPALPDSHSIDVTRVQAPGVTPTPLDEDVLESRLGELQPWYDFEVNQQTIGYGGRIREVNRCWHTGWLDPTAVGESCYGRKTGQRFGSFAYYDMFSYVLDHLAQLSSTGTAHSIPTLLFDVPQSEAHPVARALAEPNYFTGEQFDIVSYQVPPATAVGLGQTDTLVHEVGHHLGLSHQHDGFDFAEGRHLMAQGEFFFLWSGDESASTMSYLNLDDGFSQFDRDSMGRWLTAAYLNQGNQVLARLAAHRHDASVATEVVQADQDALAAVLATGAREYAEATTAAKRAYDRLLAAAARLRIPIEPQARPADDRAFGTSPMFVDPVPPLLLGRPELTAKPTGRTPVGAVPVPDRPQTGWYDGG